jgi:excisionase family DNA binding protein
MSTMTEQRPFLSVAELGNRLGVSKRTAYNLVADGVVPVILVRGVKKIPAGALERWLAEREQEALDSVRPESGGG